MAKALAAKLTPYAGAMTVSPVPVSDDAEPEASVSDELDPDTRDLVDRFSAAMAAKLLKSQIKRGVTNQWASPEWEAECKQYLLEHVAKGDPRDVAIYAAFCWHHNWSTNIDA